MKSLLLTIIRFCLLIQSAATEEKTVLEEAQRAGARERKALGSEWIPKHFELVRKKSSSF
jgi:hypothetical protein